MREFFYGKSRYFTEFYGRSQDFPGKYGITGFWVGSVHEAGKFFHHSKKENSR